MTQDAAFAEVLAGLAERNSVVINSTRDLIVMTKYVFDQGVEYGKRIAEGEK